MSGYKISQRKNASHTRRNPAININAGRGSNGLLCNRNESPFISSYADDKKMKHKKQLIERMKKLMQLGVAVVILLIIMSRSSSDGDEGAASLRAATTTVAIDSAPPPPPTPPPVTPPPTAPDTPINVQSMVDVAKSQTVAGTPIVKNPSGDNPGGGTKICGRKIYIDLSDPASWPNGVTTPDTVPTSENQSTVKNKNAVILKGPVEFGGLGLQLNSFFHAYDFAEETKRPMYITQDAWVLDMLYPLFFGPSSGNVAKDSTFWEAMQDTLSAKVIASEDALTTKGVAIPEYLGQKLLYYQGANKGKFDATARRNRRDTILRKLFQYPSVAGDKGVCALLDTLMKDEKNEKYTVIHYGTPGLKGYLGQLNGGTGGKDLTAACEMKPDYIKNILKQTNMLEEMIYLIDSDSNNVDEELHKSLMDDSEMSEDKIRTPVGSPLASYIYLAVLADVYIGNPVDQLSLWIARMRYALGIKNSFVLTEKQGENWVSWVNDDTHVELYDANRLSTPWIG